MITPARRMLLNELRKNGMSASPLSIQKTQRVLDRLDKNGKRDVHVYNALLEIALHRKEVGPVAAFLSELEENQVTPDAHTLSLLLQTAPSDQMEKLVKTFQKKYKVAATDEALLVLIERHAQDGNALRALRVFQMSKTLAEKEAAWNSLIAAHARAGAGRVRECGALLEGMAERGLVPNVVLFNVALTASATLKKEEARASVDRILALMKKLRVVPSLETLDALQVSSVKDRV